MDARTHLRQLTQPLLVLQADADRLVSESCAQEIKSTLASAVICRMAGPHCLLQIAPVKAWHEIYSWLQKS